MILLLLSQQANAQKKKKVIRSVVDTNAVLHDKYHGTVMVGGDSVFTLLQLDHKINTDYGTFTLDEAYKKPGGRILQSQTIGKWNILTATVHDADDNMVLENTDIIQVDGSDKVLFFIKTDDSTLRKLDPQLKLIEPVESYLLSRRIKAVPVKKDTLTPLEANMKKLSGRYAGKLPCADCSAITSTLTLKFAPHARSGDFTLTDKYFGSPGGDITNERRGKWNYTTKPQGNIITIDADKRGRESYYLVNKNGTLTPLDKNLQKINSPVDQTMRKQ